MTAEEALRYARMRRTDLYREDGFEESWGHETIAEVLADEVERLRKVIRDAAADIGDPHAKNSTHLVWEQLAAEAAREGGG
jgi:hypothetical protein